MKPAVSVVIPVHNRPRLVAEAVKSVLEQSYRDFELLVVDDGSTDDTVEVLRGFGEDIRLHLQSHKGVSAARNLGIDLAAADWIAFLDSDDLWLPDKLEEQVAYLNSEPECRIVYTDEIWIRNGRRVNPKQKHRKESGWIFPRSLELCLISPSSVMIHRSVFDHLGRFDESFPAGEDYDLWLRVTLHYPVHLIPRQLIVKRGGQDDQLSSSVWGLDRFRTRAIEKVLSDPGLTPEYRRDALAVLESKLKILAGGAGKRGDSTAAGEYLSRLEAIKK
jgi:glycosyltransferase involved in cell wall biosynthesis